MSTEDRIAAIRARLDAATPGPWWAADGEVIGNHSALAHVWSGRDADLIGNAPCDLAWLLEENARLRTQLEGGDR